MIKQSQLIAKRKNYYQRFSFCSQQQQSLQKSNNISKLNIFLIAAGGLIGGLIYDKFYCGPCKIQILKEEQQKKIQDQDKKEPENKIQNQNDEKEQKTSRIQLGGEWELFDLNGNKFGSENLKDDYYLLYFGFANCPDVCPTSLTKISQLIDYNKNKVESQQNKQKEQKNQEEQIIPVEKVIFVSVDPSRDNNKKIKDFLQMFDKRFLGVRADKDLNENDTQYKEMLKKFRVYTSKIEFEEETQQENQNNNINTDNTNKNGSNTKNQTFKNYTVDHTDIIYLMGPGNQYLGPLTSYQDVNDIHTQMQVLIHEKLQQQN
ncbi:Thioredoxin-like fold [Pseudocohnilembus persalinus]|uniref:Thioredoxin-like fold n=1 Tax=Pseudocohnilembus persalinus TaxID=266149 RepID=A0A0V0QAG2_PSEPJ|nr:Thioredoxin-like fold [Pseudocohnilembus persalinus]|eukprot:KRW99060.1 Thioredoxin-like fold [Pseudocohnilembus persalinus]